MRVAKTMGLNNMDEAILVFNAGSSSLKFALLACKDLALIYQGKIENIFDEPQFTAVNKAQKQIINESILVAGYESSLTHLFDWLSELPVRFTLKAVGHRVVHGGVFFNGPCLINAETLKKISSLIPLAPLHQPLNILAIESIQKIYPSLPQVACFDTAFHQTQDSLAKLFAIPQGLSAEGIIRYGFHGISYEYIASVLPEYLAHKDQNKVIVAHLGNGASLCAMNNGKSRATSMGFTTLDGLMMGTRCGTIDPGIILYLMQEKKYSAKQVSELLYQESGLLGVSGISSNMHELESSKEPHAIEAVDLFCYRAACELSSLMVVLNGCDAIVFTAGIGEHSAVVRKKICAYLEWLGLVLDDGANRSHARIISANQSAVKVCIIPTNEEYMIAQHTMSIIQN
jgi:acetate kinase